MIYKFSMFVLFVVFSFFDCNSTERPVSIEYAKQFAMQATNCKVFHSIIMPPPSIPKTEKTIRSAFKKNILLQNVSTHPLHKISVVELEECEGRYPSSNIVEPQIFKVESEGNSYIVKSVKHNMMRELVAPRDITRLLEQRYYNKNLMEIILPTHWSIYKEGEEPTAPRPLCEFRENYSSAIFNINMSRKRYMFGDGPLEPVFMN